MSAPTEELGNHALSAAFRLIDRGALPELAGRLRSETLRLLKSDHPLPKDLINLVFASEDRELLTALAMSSPKDRSTLLQRLAELGDPSLAVLLYSPKNDTHDSELAAVRTAVLAAASRNPTNPDWYTEGGLVPELLACENLDVLIPVLRGPFPELIKHALTLLSDERFWEKSLTVVNGCAELVRYGGADQLGTVAELPGWNEELRQTLRKVAMSANPAAELAKAKARESSVAQRLHSVPLDGPDGMDPPLDLSGPLDWNLLLSEHQRKPYFYGALNYLVTRPDCPPDFLLAAFLTTSQVSYYTVHPIPWEALTKMEWDDENFGDLSTLLSHGVPTWFPIDRVLAEAKPAVHILNALPYDQEPVRQAVGALTGALGPSDAAWRAIHALLPRFKGSCTELVSAALTQAEKYRGRPWPKEASARIPAKYPKGYRDAVLRLFANAPDDVQDALIPHLGERSVQQLLIFHEPSAELRTRIVNAHGRQAQIHMAAHHTLNEEKIEYLLGLDDPRINAMLYDTARLTTAQKRQLLAGRPFQPGHTEPVPLTTELIELLTSYAGDYRHRSDLLPICESGNPQLIQILLDSTKLHAPESQLLLLIRLWERQGAEAVRTLLGETAFPNHSTHPLSPEVRATAANALSNPGGLATLRKHLEAERTPQAIITALRSERVSRSAQKATEAVPRIVEEIGDRFPWKELLAEHLRDPLPDPLLAALAGVKGCPEELREASSGAKLRLPFKMHLNEQADARPNIVDLLRDHPKKCSPSWMLNALLWDQLTAMDVLSMAEPAHAAVSVLLDPDLELDRVPIYRETQKLVKEHLGNNLEAWAVAMRLLPEFPGTILELIATAGAVAS